MNRQAVVSVGDTLKIEVRGTTGELIRTLQHKISVADVHRAFTELRLTPADLIPKRTVLLANYPNPFNPETWLPYQLQTTRKSRFVSIRQQDNSSDIWTSDSNRRGITSGSHVLLTGMDGMTWGERLASGVYFYQLRTLDSSATRKMVIMK